MGAPLFIVHAIFASDFSGIARMNNEHPINLPVPVTVILRPINSLVVHVLQRLRGYSRKSRSQPIDSVGSFLLCLIDDDPISDEAVDFKCP